MNENALSQGNAIDTNDSYEAVSVFRGWKNVFFAILIACLLLTQIAFWLVNLKQVNAPILAEPTAGTPGTNPVSPPPGVIPSDRQPGAAVPQENGAPATPAAEAFLGVLDFDSTARAIELLNGVLVVVGVLYAASIFFGMMVSLVGRLGGLNHISRAFVLALIASALLIPWQVLGLNVLGVTWTPEELARWLPAKDIDFSNTVIFYLRFTGYWLAVVLLLGLAQARTGRWKNAILHRLEII